MAGRLLPPEGITDVTSRQICETFEQYIYLYEVMSQLSRLAYCDSGIILKIFESSFGKDNVDVMVNINQMDIAYVNEKRAPLNEQKAASIADGIPHESYALGRAPDQAKRRYGAYISTEKALAACIIDTTVANGILKQKGPFNDKDIIIAFKGTNTFKELIHDVKSVVTRLDLYYVATSLGFTPPESDKDSFIAGAFTTVLIDAWPLLIQSIGELIPEGTDAIRLFCTGHGLGGAYCTLFGFILGYLKSLPPTTNETSKLLSSISSIHVISFGTPALCADKARNVLNGGLRSGFMTFDRLVTQKIPTLTVQPYFTNIIPLTPALFSHPGYKQKATDPKQDKRRPYKLTSIYKMYNKGTPKTYTYTIPDEGKSALKQVEIDGKAAATQTQTATQDRTAVQKGGLFGLLDKYKSIYQKEAVKYSSNFISIPINSVTGMVAPHIFYLGMVYLLTPRFPGMKNPVPINQLKSAYFGFYDDPGAGVLIKYVDSPRIAMTRGTSAGVSKNVNSRGTDASSNTNVQLHNSKRKRRTRVNTIFSGGRKTRRTAEK
jgi:hypothetical protein